MKIWKVTVVAAALALFPLSGDAQEVVETCPPICKPGTVEHDVWWCGHKDDQINCELEGKVECEWFEGDNLCKPAGGEQ